MSLGTKITSALRVHHGPVSFEQKGRRVLCFIDGVGGSGATPEAALNGALKSWDAVRRESAQPLKKRKSSRKKTSRRTR